MPCHGAARYQPLAQSAIDSASEEVESVTVVFSTRRALTSARVAVYVSGQLHGVTGGNSG